MSSLHKDPQGRSPFFYCAFRGPDGKRLLRSTKTADRKLATKICREWQSASEKARNHELTAVQCRQVLGELLSFSSGEVLVTHTTGVWIRSWLEGKRGSTAPGTFAKYRQVTEDFLAHLGNRATAPLTAITPGDIASFRDGLRASGCSAKTANLARSIISAAFLAALKQGHLAHNPAQAVDSLRIRKTEGREAFTHEELARIVAVAEGDWRGLILCASTTGLRLMDAATLTWQAIDLERGLLTIRTQKTDTAITMPLHEDFAQWLAAQQRGIGLAHVFRSLANIGTGGSNGLSMQFRELMHRAGITERIIQADGDKGRTRSSKSFHSLRHYVVSQLANQGVAVDVRKSLVGHSDSKSHAIYTHHDDLVRRDAIAKLPSVLNHAVQA